MLHMFTKTANVALATTLSLGFAVGPVGADWPNIRQKVEAPGQHTAANDSVASSRLKASQSTHVDQFGDPLPPGAVVL